MVGVRFVGGVHAPPSVGDVLPPHIGRTSHWAANVPDHSGPSCMQHLALSRIIACRSGVLFRCHVCPIRSNIDSLGFSNLWCPHGETIYHLGLVSTCQCDMAVGMGVFSFNTDAFDVKNIGTE